MTALVPTALCIDVEPDVAVPPPGDRGPWTGFEQLTAVLDEVRGRIRDRTGRRFEPIWCLRMDRQIERVYGSADHVVRRHPDLVGRLLDADDTVGVHVHPYRWDDDGTTFSEHADRTWSAECNSDAIGAFVDCFDRLPALTRQGGYFLPPETLAVVERHGIGFDMTAEPGRPPLLADPSFGHHASAPSSDWRLTPTVPYRPAREDPTRAAGDEAGGVCIVPLSAARVHPPTRPRHRRVAHRLLRGRPGLMPLNPWRPWGDGKAYWDVVDRLLRRGEIGHVALAVRTDDPASATFRQVISVLGALAEHPLAARLDVGPPAELFGPVDRVEGSVRAETDDNRAHDRPDIGTDDNAHDSDEALADTPRRRPHR